VLLLLQPVGEQGVAAPCVSFALYASCIHVVHIRLMLYRHDKAAARTRPTGLHRYLAYTTKYLIARPSGMAIVLLYIVTASKRHYFVLTSMCYAS